MNTRPPVYRHTRPPSSYARLPLPVYLLLCMLCGFAAHAEDQAMFTDFERLERPDSPNTRLVAPALASLPAADAAAPTFAVPPSRVAAAWQQVVGDAPRTRITGVSDDGLQIEAEQRSALFGFVDDISFRAIPLDEGGSTFVAYSRSRVGYWDFGVNRRRLESWIGALRGALDATAD